MTTAPKRTRRRNNRSAGVQLLAKRVAEVSSRWALSSPSLNLLALSSARCGLKRML
ncbi:hypothetical protein ACUY3M_00680 [Corynebacterium suicordis]